MLAPTEKTKTQNADEEEGDDDEDDEVKERESELTNDIDSQVKRLMDKAVCL